MRLAYSKDWVHHLLRSKFTSGFQALVACIFELAAAADGVDR
jgi:hypothetical protein